MDKHGNYVYRTGLAFEIPDGYVGLLFPRSSVSKTGLSLRNSVGVLDSGIEERLSLSSLVTQANLSMMLEIGLGK